MQKGDVVGHSEVENPTKSSLVQNNGELRADPSPSGDVLLPGCRWGRGSGGWLNSGNVTAELQRLQCC